MTAPKMMLTVCLLLAGTTGFSGPKAGELPRRARLAMEIPEAAAALAAKPTLLIGDCAACEDCGHTLTHKMTGTGTDGPPHSDCLSGDCADAQHPACGTTLAPTDFQHLWDDALNGAIDRVAEFADKHSQIVTVNWERRAVQVQQCGSLVANIPIVDAESTPR